MRKEASDGSSGVIIPERVRDLSPSGYLPE
jgi:hypothetical protein